MNYDDELDGVISNAPNKRYNNMGFDGVIDDGELSDEALEGVMAGTSLSYEEAKARSKFKTVSKEPEKTSSIEDGLSEISEEDLEKYMGGIRIEGEEYMQR